VCTGLGRGWLIDGVDSNKIGACATAAAFASDTAAAVAGLRTDEEKHHGV
jgi:hypothetical protein